MRALRVIFGAQLMEPILTQLGFSHNLVGEGLFLVGRIVLLYFWVLLNEPFRHQTQLVNISFSRGGQISYLVGGIPAWW